MFVYYTIFDHLISFTVLFECDNLPQQFMKTVLDIQLWIFLKTYRLGNIVTWIFSTKPLNILIGPQTSLGEWPKTQEKSSANKLG